MDRDLGLTEADVIESFRVALGVEDITDDPRAMTIRELRQAFGRGEKWVRGRVEALVAEGKAEQVNVLRRGHVTSAYVLLTGTEKPPH